MIFIHKISTDFAKVVMQSSNLDERKLCSGIKKFYCEGIECNNIYTITEDPIGEKSLNGVVYQACLKQTCDYIAKWQKNTEIALAEAEVQQIAAKNGLAPFVRQIMACDEGAIIIMDALVIAVSRLIKMLLPEQLNLTIKNNLAIFEKAIKNTKLDIKYNLREIKSVENLRELRSKINRLLYASGHDPLSDIQTVADSPKQQETRKNIIKKVFELLNKLHSLGIVHADAHLNNFMADKNMEIKIIDFGTAKPPTSDDDLKKDYKRCSRDISQYISEGYTNLEYLENYIQTELQKIK